MRSIFRVFLLTLSTAPGLAAQPSRPVGPLELVGRAVAAMGDLPVLESLTTMRVDGVQHDYLLGNAERAEGPFRVTYSRFTELRDNGRGALRRSEWDAAAAPGTPGAAERISIVADSVYAQRSGGREFGGQPALLEDARDRIDASPERALHLARLATNIRREAPVARFGILHDRVSFPYRNGRMRIEISRDSHLPTAVETIRTYPDDFRRGNFGDVTVRYEYAEWTAQPSGLVWPLQHLVTLNGNPMRNVTVAMVAAAPSSADSFAVSDTVRKMFAANMQLSPARFHFGTRGTLPDIADGIARLRDFWAMTLVKQADGVVIFEAHLSASYLHEVIAEASRRWPGSKIKAIVMTSDPWAHIGGVREAVALGIPIYVSARSIPFLTALTKAPFTLEPDSLARAPRAPKFIGVSAKTVIGGGVNRIELYPVGGAYAERMTMAYFPTHRLLYGADLVFPDRAAGNGYLRTPLIDLRRAVEREKLAVDTVFCVQASISPAAWAAFVPSSAP